MSEPTLVRRLRPQEMSSPSAFLMNLFMTRPSTARVVAASQVSQWNGTKRASTAPREPSARNRHRFLKIKKKQTRKLFETAVGSKDVFELTSLSYLTLAASWIG